MRFLVMSDVHIDNTYRALREVYGNDLSGKSDAYLIFQDEVERFVAGLDERIDGIGVVGDISNEMLKTLDVLHRLADGSYYDKNDEMYEVPVYFVPGNHDVWAVSDRVFYDGETDETSDIEYGYSSDEAMRMYVESYYNLIGNPLISGEVGIVGGFSWYDYSLGSIDLSDEKLERTKRGIWGDRFCNLRGTDREISDHYMDLFKGDLERACESGVKRLLVMNHFVPHEDFVVETDSYNWNVCNAFMGTSEVHELLARVGSEYEVEITCVFGHTHFDYEGEIDGVRYECKPVGYPFEWGVFGELSVKDYKRRLRDRFYVLEI